MSVIYKWVAKACFFINGFTQITKSSVWEAWPLGRQSIRGMYVIKVPPVIQTYGSRPDCLGPVAAGRACRRLIHGTNGWYDTQGCLPHCLSGTVLRGAIRQLAQDTHQVSLSG